jgi:hypothetical protein
VQPPTSPKQKQSQSFRTPKHCCSYVPTHPYIKMYTFLAACTMTPYLGGDVRAEQACSGFEIIITSFQRHILNWQIDAGNITIAILDTLFKKTTFRRLDPVSSVRNFLNKNMTTDNAQNFSYMNIQSWQTYESYTDNMLLDGPVLAISHLQTTVTEREGACSVQRTACLTDSKVVTGLVILQP